MVSDGLPGVVGPSGQPLPNRAGFSAARVEWWDYFFRVRKTTRTSETKFPYTAVWTDGHSARAHVTR